MKLSLVWAAVAVSLLGSTKPSIAQLAASPWPKHFQGNGNQSRTTTVGPVSSLAVASTVSFGGSYCSTPTIGPDGTIYVTRYSGDANSPSATLYAYGVESNALKSLWSIDLTPHAHALSAPTIDIRGYAWMGAAGKDGTVIRSKLIRVDLNSKTSAAAISNTDPDDSSTGAYSPPAIDSDGTVYICSQSISSGSGGASSAAFDANLTKRWEKQSGSLLPVPVYRLALRDAGSGGIHNLFLHGWHAHIDSMRYHRVTRLDTTASTTDPQVVFNSTEAIGSGSVGGVPVLSNDSRNSFYTASYISTNNSTYWKERSRTDGAVSNQTVIGSTESFPNGAGVLNDDNVLSHTPSSALKLFTASLGLVASWSMSGTAAPSIDGNGNWFVVASDGSVRVRRASDGIWLSVAAKASGEVAIRSSTTVVVSTNDGTYRGLALLVGN